MFRENQFSQNLYLIYLKKINENQSSCYPEKTVVHNARKTELRTNFNSDFNECFV
jgi:hypothetical protein